MRKHALLAIVLLTHLATTGCTYLKQSGHVPSNAGLATMQEDCRRYANSLKRQLDTGLAFKITGIILAAVSTPLLALDASRDDSGLTPFGISLITSGALGGVFSAIGEALDSGEARKDFQSAVASYASGLANEEMPAFTRCLTGSTP